MKRTGESAFETGIEAYLPANGYVSVPGAGFDRERALFPEAVLGSIRETRPPDEWGRREALPGDRTGAQALTDLCKWMDRAGALATLRYGVECYGTAAYYRLLEACADNPNVERKKAARALARFVRLHPHNVAQKTEVMAEHFDSDISRKTINCGHDPAIRLPSG